MISILKRWHRNWNNGLATSKLAIRQDIPISIKLAVSLIGLVILCGAGITIYHYGGVAAINSPKSHLLVQDAWKETQRLKIELENLRQRMGETTQQLLIEQAARETLSIQLQQQRTDNSALKEQVAFYESLLTRNERAPVLSIETFQVEPLAQGHYRLRLILIQGQSVQQVFKGEVDFRLLIERNGKRSELIWPQPRLGITVARFTRIERETKIPEDVRLRQVEVRVYAQNEKRPRLTHIYDVKG